MYFSVCVCMCIPQQVPGPEFRSPAVPAPQTHFCLSLSFLSRPSIDGNSTEGMGLFPLNVAACPVVFTVLTKAQYIMNIWMSKLQTQVPYACSNIGLGFSKAFKLWKDALLCKVVLILSPL